MRSGAVRLSRALVRLYPPAWRQRYSAEMLALIDDAGSTWAHALDLAAGCADAWFRAVLRHPYAADFLGAVLVRVVSGTAMYFSLMPSEPWRVALHGVFWLLALFLYGAMFLMLFLALVQGFRNAWKQWFGMIHGRQPMTVGPPWLPDAGPSSRQVRALRAVILITAIGADFTPTDATVSDYLHFQIPAVIPWMTYWMLQYVPIFLSALQLLASGRWRRRRVINS